MKTKTRHASPSLRPTKSAVKKKTGKDWKKKPKEEDPSLGSSEFIIMMRRCSPGSNGFRKVARMSMMILLRYLVCTKFLSCSAFTTELSITGRFCSPVARLATDIFAKDEKCRVDLLLTFDLDDTLFPTNEVVNDANVAMIEHMAKVYNGVKTTLEDFLETTRDIRKDLTGPITYSDLRRRAIAKELRRRDDDAAVEQCFQVWLDERHAAAERYLFPDAIDCLDQVRRDFPTACIAAVTNGRGNPLFMPSTLEPYFDFCVSGEDDNVFPNRKPHPGIFKATMQRYQEHCLPKHCHDKSDPLWFHVGDCLANDVGASASMGAIPIWYCPDRDVVSAEDVAGNMLTKELPQWSTATKGDRQKRVQLITDAANCNMHRIFSLTELPKVVSQIEKQSVRDSKTDENLARQDTCTGTEYVDK